MRKTESQKIALCGVLGALSVVLLLVGAALQIGTYAAPMLAAFLLIPVLDEYGPKYALLLYATVSILSVLLVPELELEHCPYPLVACPLPQTFYRNIGIAVKDKNAMSLSTRRFIEHARRWVGQHYER